MLGISWWFNSLLGVLLMDRLELLEQLPSSLLFAPLEADQRGVELVPLLGLLGVEAGAALLAWLLQVLALELLPGVLGLVRLLW